VAVPVPGPVAVPDLEVWRAIVERLRAERPALASVLEHAVPLELNPRRVTVGFEPAASFFAARASEPDSLEALTREVRSHFSAPTQVGVDLSARPGPSLKTVASIDAEKRTAELLRARADIEDHPVVREVVRLFGAQLRDVKLPSGE
jgi:DNA polymerase-3 subunit gamma/tau